MPSKADVIATGQLSRRRSELDLVTLGGDSGVAILGCKGVLSEAELGKLLCFNLGSHYHGLIPYLT